MRVFDFNAQPHAGPLAQLAAAIFARPGCRTRAGWFLRRTSVIPALLLAGFFSIAAPQAWSSQHPQAGAATAQKPSPASLKTQVDRVLQEMSRLTGLPIKAPVKKKVVDRQQIRKLLIQSMHAEYTPKQIHMQQATLRAFGLVSRSFDLEKFLISFYTEQAAGFYDPRSKTMYIASWIPPKMQQMVLAHELTHALQDQNFNLLHYMKSAQKDSDAEAARQAVVEGYATAAMFQDMVKPTPISILPSFDKMYGQLYRQQMAQFPVFSKAPLFFRLEAMFPYVQGATFVEQALKHGDWKSLNELFASPPTTTKAIFQPKIYFNHVSLPKVELPRQTPLNKVHGLKEVDENTLGELGFDSLLSQFLSENTAKSVSSKWMGDRYIVYEDPAAHNYALVVRTRWTNSEAALSFFRKYHAVLTQKYPNLSPDAHSTADRFIAHTASGEVIMMQKGDEVRWTEGVPKKKVKAMRKWLVSLQ